MCEEEECTPAATPANQCLRGPADVRRWMLDVSLSQRAASIADSWDVPSPESRVTSDAGKDLCIIEVQTAGRPESRNSL